MAGWGGRGGEGLGEREGGGEIPGDGNWKTLLMQVKT